MKIIFLTDIKGQGKKNDIKEVKDGYAKFLIANKSAVMYTNKSFEVLNVNISNTKKQEELEIKTAEELKAKILKIKVEVKLKTGKEDKVFGSVSSKQISEILKKNGYNIDKKIIKIDSDINTLGTHIVHIMLHKKVTCDLPVLVSKER